MVQSGGAQRTLLICMHRWERPRMRGGRLPMSSNDPRRPRGHESTGFHRRGRLERPSISRIKKINFSPPRKCPIDLFGPVANRTILKRLHDASKASASIRSSLCKGLAFSLSESLFSYQTRQIIVLVWPRLLPSLLPRLTSVCVPSR